jgi:tRNA modification GTPase
MKTIVALSTPPLNCAIHIIRVSGDNAYEIVNKICKPKLKKIKYHIQNTNIIINNKVIDNVIVNQFIAPHSFTGEDSIEINCHGGYYLSQQIINALVSHGCELAKPGEFTMRGVLNGKINLIQAEAINNLINAQNDYAIQSANISLLNKYPDKLKQFKKILFELVSKIEINIDYPEEKQTNKKNKNSLLNNVNYLIKEMTNVVNISKRISYFSNGINVAIVGDTNVGKSSLLNAFLQQDKAIVTDIPGTTRDVIQASVNIDGLTFNFLDTAGIRNTDDTIENIGIKKAIQTINDADLILHVIDGSKSLSKQYYEIDKLIKNKNHINVINKSDLKSNVKINGIKVCAIKKQINPLIKAIIKQFPKINLTNHELILQSNNSINIFINTIEKLELVKTQINDNESLDMIVENLHIALGNILEILGERKDFNFLNEMFKNFCLGK